MELYQIILAVTGGIIAILLGVIGYFLDNLIKDTKKANQDLSKKIDLVQLGLNKKIDLIQSSVVEIKTQVTVQDRINQELKTKDQEIWEELKQVVGRLNDFNEKNTKFSEELKEAIEAIKRIMLSHINDNRIHKNVEKI